MSSTSQNRARVPIVTSWTLWRHLRYPPIAHPLFKRALRTPAASFLITPHIGWLAPLLGGLACCGTWTLLVRLQSSVPVFLLMAMVLASTVYVSMWTIDTSMLIARERERDTYDLLCLAPSGALGVHWATCAAILHRVETVVWIDLLRKAGAGMLLFLFVGIVITAAPRERTLDPASLLPLLLDMVSLAVAFYVDHVQTTVLGSLVGMHAPFFARSTAVARVWALLGFLAIQFGVILVTVISVAAASPFLPSGISPLVFGLLACCLLREVAVIAAWRWLARRLTTDPARIDLEVG